MLPNRSLQKSGFQSSIAIPPSPRMTTLGEPRLGDPPSCCRITMEEPRMTGSEGARGPGYIADTPDQAPASWLLAPCLHAPLLAPGSWTPVTQPTIQPLRQPGAVWHIFYLIFEWRYDDWVPQTEERYQCFKKCPLFVPCHHAPLHQPKDESQILTSKISESLTTLQ